MNIDDIKAQIDSYDCDYVTITGGEPLGQPNCLKLMELLCEAAYQVSLETSGAMPIEKVDKRVSVVMDLKTPGSSECDKNRYENIPYLKTSDQLKFVICDEKDYQWSKAKIDQFDLTGKVDEILFSPSHGQLDAGNLAEWILRDRLKVRMQLQLHKQIWGSEQGR